MNDATGKSVYFDQTAPRRKHIYTAQHHAKKLQRTYHSQLIEACGQQLHTYTSRRRKSGKSNVVDQIPARKRYNSWALA